MSYEFIRSVVLDPTGTRIPVLRLMDPDERTVLKVYDFGETMNLEVGVQVVIKTPIPKMVMVALAGELQAFIREADTLRAVPASRTYEVERPIASTPKKGKAKKANKAAKAKHPHPSHYPDIVFKGEAPPPPPGGWPKGAGIWEEHTHVRDEYGKKGGLLPLNENKDDAL